MISYYVNLRDISYQLLYELKIYNKSKLELENSYDFFQRNKKRGKFFFSLVSVRS